MIQSFNNKTEKVGDDFKKNIIRGSKLEVAARIFTIYGFDSFKRELKSIDSLKFIFTDPTFIELEKNRKEKRRFEINTNNRQKAISGSEFEINLKNRGTKKWKN